MIPRVQVAIVIITLATTIIMTIIVVTLMGAIMIMNIGLLTSYHGYKI